MATPERSKWVQEAGKIFLAQISEKRCEAPRPKKYLNILTKKLQKPSENNRFFMNEALCDAFEAKLGPYGSKNYAGDDYEVGF